jgi:2'-5' RNA ligase
MTGTTRAFIAIDLPEPVRKRIGGLQAALPVGKPAKAENLHLTLAFLGDQPGELLEEVHHGLERLAEPSFELGLAGLDTFDGREPRVLYVGVAKNPALEQLQRRVRAALYASGLTLSRTRFRPHVTLARFRPGMALNDLERLRRFLSEQADFALEPVPVTGFSLYSSILRPEGAQHDLLARYPLG